MDNLKINITKGLIGRFNIFVLIISALILISCGPDPDPKPNIHSSVPQLTELNSNSLIINWEAVPEAQYYQIFRDGEQIVGSNNITTTSYQDTDITLNQIYTYTVKICFSTGCTDEFPSLRVSVAAPLTPGIPILSNLSSNSVIISWRPVERTTYYEIYRNGTQIDGDNQDVTANSYTDNSISPDTYYGYTIKACNSIGCSLESQALNTKSLQEPIANPVPAVPSDLNALIITANSATLTWTAISGAAYYEIYRNGTQIDGDNQDVTASPFIDDFLSPNTQYSYSISSCNSNADCSMQSAGLSVRTTSDIRGSLNLTSGSISINQTTGAPLFTPGDNPSKPSVLMGLYTDENGGFAEVVIVNTNHTNHTALELNEHPLLLVPGGTGGKALQQFDTHMLYGHRLGILVGFRGTSLFDSVESCSTALNPTITFVECLMIHPKLSEYNPQQTARDTVEVTRILSNNIDIMIDSAPQKPHDLFNSEFNGYNSYTGSYGGTVLSFIANQPDSPSFRRVFVDNPDGPLEKVISQGFEVNLEIMNRFFAACEDDNICNSLFPNLRTNLPLWMEMHHSGDGVMVTYDNSEYVIYSGDLFDIFTNAWEENSNDINLIKPVYLLVGTITQDLSATEVTVDVTSLSDQVRASFKNIIELTTSNPFFRGSYEVRSQTLDLLSPELSISTFILSEESTAREFINRVGLICSSYILRSNMPDNRVLFDQQISRTTLSPWRYGFLIQYQSFLELCPQLVNNIVQLEAPSNLNVPSESTLVYFGGMDPKHSYESAQELDANFMNSNIVVEDLRGQDSGVNGRELTTNITLRFFSDDPLNIDALKNRVNTANDQGLGTTFE